MSNRNSQSSVNHSRKSKNSDISVRRSISPENGSDVKISNSSPNEKQNQLNEEYIAISNEIEKHNQTIDELKKQISEKSNLSIKTCIDEKELQCLTCCLHKELNCLKMLKQTIVEKQSMNPTQAWGVIPLATTLEEEHMPSLMLYTPTATINKPEMTEFSAKDRSTACVQENLIAENVELEEDKNELQTAVAMRDKMIECLQQKMQCLQFQLTKICIDQSKQDPFGKQTPCTSKPHSSSQKSSHDQPTADPQCKVCNDKDQLKIQLNRMNCVLNRLLLELETKNQLGHKRSQEAPPPPPDASICSELANYDELKQQHHELMREYAKQDCEIRCLRQKLAAICCGTEICPETETENTEVEICKKRVRDLEQEQEEHKILIAEQRDQVEDYRQKYMQAQQKVLEQKCHMDNMELTNKKIEEQINLEIRRIKCKFQEKLKELAPLPQLLENQKFKCGELTKCKDELECKFAMVCEELSKIKKELKKIQSNGDGGWESKCKKLCGELANFKQNLDQMTCDKMCLENQLKQCRDELECLRTESSRLISRLKERSECARVNLQTHINSLEMELAQCYANNVLALQERDNVIGAMKNQLNELSCNFDSTQKQIRNLKNRITVLSDVSPNSVDGCHCVGSMNC